ncbi:MAG: hypothetical protein HXY23_14705, partial [Parvularculaceae bacterium]|nr:hypothetical protein [Parvularculaceae bacterium]
MQESRHWRDYLGDSIYRDFAVDLAPPPGDPNAPPIATPVPGRRYIHGYGLIAVVHGPDEGGTGGVPEDVEFVHTDLLGSTRLMT